MMSPSKMAPASTKSIPCLRILARRFPSSHSKSIGACHNICTYVRGDFQMPSMILVGDVNLMNVEDPAVPFARVGEEMRAADLVFANLECCLYEPPDAHAVEHEGFFADPEIAGEALRIAGIGAVGLANNVNYGSAAILGSIARLDRFGVAHTGAGVDLAAARASAIVTAGGMRVGCVQRSSV